MENPRILKRRWSLIFKVQIVCAVFAFLLTSALAVIQAMQVSLPHNGLGQAFVELYYMAMTPANVLVHVGGVSEKLGLGAFQISAVALNTILAFCFVGLLGRLIAIVKRKLQRPKS